MSKKQGTIANQNVCELNAYSRGFSLGYQQGMSRGTAEILSVFLEHLLKQRFGILPQWAKRKLKTADSLALSKWGDNFRRAIELEDVFKE